MDKNRKLVLIVSSITLSLTYLLWSFYEGSFIVSTWGRESGGLWLGLTIFLIMVTVIAFAVVDSPDLSNTGGNG